MWCSNVVHVNHELQDSAAMQGRINQHVVSYQRDKKTQQHLRQHL